MVDFVDNANMFNMPYSLHRVLDIAKYQPMAYVLAPENKRKLDQDMLFQGEKPEAWLDVPIDMSDYEIIDLFNWQNGVKDMSCSYKPVLLKAIYGYVDSSGRAALPEVDCFIDFYEDRKAYGKIGCILWMFAIRALKNIICG